MTNLRIVEFNSTREHGQMNKNFYPKDMDGAEKTRLMHEHKQALMRDMGLSYKDIFMPIQKSSNNPDKYKDGLCYTLTPEDIVTYDDLYDYDVNADIVKLTPETRNVAIAYPVADCAVVKAVNMRTDEVTLAHCGGEYIDRYLPMQTIDALGGAEKDIRVYVSPFAYSLFYKNATKLVWANNPKVWEQCKEYDEHNGITSVKIDVYKALRRQLLERRIPEENIYMSPYNISECDLFYSNSRGYQDESFNGRFLAGIALVDNDHKIENKPHIKVLK